MKSVLTVDDSPSIRQAVKVTLGPAGYEVLQAEDGLDGLAKAKSKQVNMVITDLNMPNMDGMTFIRHVRKLAGYAGVPIVFLTTESDSSIKQEAKSAGATGWITKPFNQEQLLSVVRKLIGS
jgi:two-component system chemotaxis response regulator CheY